MSIQHTSLYTKMDRCYTIGYCTCMVGLHKVIKGHSGEVYKLINYGRERQSNSLLELYKASKMGSEL